MKPYFARLGPFPARLIHLRRFACFAFVPLLCFCFAIQSHSAGFSELRHKLVEEVAASAREDGFTLSPAVVKAMEKVERDRFVPPGWLPLPITTTLFPSAMDKPSRSPSWLH